MSQSSVAEAIGERILQRALTTRNRDTRDPVALEALCKLGCNCDESMLQIT